MTDLTEQGGAAPELTPHDLRAELRALLHHSRCMRDRQRRFHNRLKGLQDRAGPESGGSTPETADEVTPKSDRAAKSEKGRAKRTPESPAGAGASAGPETGGLWKQVTDPSQWQSQEEDFDQKIQELNLVMAWPEGVPWPLVAVESRQLTPREKALAKAIRSLLMLGRPTVPLPMVQWWAPWQSVMEQLKDPEVWGEPVSGEQLLAILANHDDLAKGTKGTQEKKKKKKATFQLRVVTQGAPAMHLWMRVRPNILSGHQLTLDGQYVPTGKGKKGSWKGSDDQPRQKWAKGGQGWQEPEDFDPWAKTSDQHSAASGWEERGSGKGWRDRGGSWDKKW